MLSAKNELAIRKELLLVRSGLYRAQLKYEAMALRERVAGGSSWLARAVTILSVARTVFSVVSFFRK